MKIIDSFNKIFSNKERILIVMPHPDDAEIYCGGTIARLTSEGKKVKIIKMTYGEKGCKQEKITEVKLRQIRKTEDQKAMKILGIKKNNNIYLDLGDGKVENDFKTIEKIVRQIRGFKPDLIITTNPEDMIIRFGKNINWLNHWDHINTGKVTLNASYPYSRDISFFPEHLKNKKLSSHICTEFFLTDYYNHIDNVFIDVTDFIDIRIKAHACHSSQYSLEDAKDSADFFTKNPDYLKGRRFERFRYVFAD